MSGNVGKEGETCWATADVSACALPWPRPAAVTGLVATHVTSNGFVLSWQSSLFARGYNVFLDGSLVASIGSTSYTFTGLSPRTTYLAAVAATAFELTSEQTQISVSTIYPPATPANLRVVNVDESYVNPILTWDPVEGATGYYVYRNYLQFGPIPGATSTTFMDGGVLMIPIYGNNMYEYQVTAINGCGESDRSQSVYIDGNPS